MMALLVCVVCLIYQCGTLFEQNFLNMDTTMNVLEHRLCMKLDDVTALKSEAKMSPLPSRGWWQDRS